MTQLIAATGEVIFMKAIRQTVSKNMGRKWSTARRYKSDPAGPIASDLLAEHGVNGFETNLRIKKNYLRVVW